jgi:hypothetical protein
MWETILVGMVHHVGCLCAMAASRYQTPPLMMIIISHMFTAGTQHTPQKFSKTFCFHCAGLHAC